MGRATILGLGLAVCLLVAVAFLFDLQTRTRVPLGLEKRDCSGLPIKNEQGWEAWEHKGGRTTRHVKIWLEGEALTTEDVAEGRDLTQYDKLELADPEPRPVVEEWKDAHLWAQARTFLWEHWQNRKRAYLMLTLHSVDSMGTFYIFIEQDDFHRWRIYARVLHRKEIDDQPTDYSMRWVHPVGWNKPAVPLARGEGPDPLKDKLEFRDVCGQLDGLF